MQVSKSLRFFLISSLVLIWIWTAAPSPAQVPQPLYVTHAIHDPNGTGKFYMGREIAQVMGPGGISWLDRPERKTEEMPNIVLDALNLKGNEVVVDFGAGSGYFSFLMAPKLNKGGKVLAVDLQDEMLSTIRQRARALKLSNVEVNKSSETDPNLPPQSVDLVLLVDVYHELSFPYEVMTKIRQALKPGGQVVFVEYRKEDPNVPIKEVHKTTVKQLQKEMAVVGLVPAKVIETLPLQHIEFFRKSE